MSVSLFPPDIPKARQPESAKVRTAAVFPRVVFSGALGRQKPTWPAPPRPLHPNQARGGRHAKTLFPALETTAGPQTRYPKTSSPIHHVHTTTQRTNGTTDQGLSPHSFIHPCSSVAHPPPRASLCWFPFICRHCLVGRGRSGAGVPLVRPRRSRQDKAAPGRSGIVL